MGPPVPQEDTCRVCQAMRANPMLAVTILDLDMNVVFLSRKVAAAMFDDTPEKYVRRNLYDLFPKAWVDERARLLQAAHADGRPRLLRSIRNGLQIETTITPLGSDDPSQPPRFLLVTVEGEHEIDAVDGLSEVVESAYAHLGPLDVLTARELEVLALVKQGLTNREIGKLLFRSAKTVENHIGTINQKLHTSSRVQMALIAQHAGLEVSDARLERVH